MSTALMMSSSLTEGDDNTFTLLYQRICMLHQRIISKQSLFHSMTASECTDILLALISVTDIESLGIRDVVLLQCSLLHYIFTTGYSTAITSVSDMAYLRVCILNDERCWRLLSRVCHNDAVVSNAARRVVIAIVSSDALLAEQWISHVVKHFIDAMDGDHGVDQYRLAELLHCILSVSSMDVMKTTSDNTLKRKASSLSNVNMSSCSRSRNSVEQQKRQRHHSVHESGNILNEDLLCTDGSHMVVIDAIQLLTEHTSGIIRAIDNAATSVSEANNTQDAAFHAYGCFMLLKLIKWILRRWSKESFLNIIPMSATILSETLRGLAVALGTDAWPRYAAPAVGKKALDVMLTMLNRPPLSGRDCATVVQALDMPWKSFNDVPIVWRRALFYRNESEEALMTLQRKMVLLILVLITNTLRVASLQQENVDVVYVAVASLLKLLMTSVEKNAFGSARKLVDVFVIQDNAIVGLLHSTLDLHVVLNSSISFPKTLAEETTRFHNVMTVLSPHIIFIEFLRAIAWDQVVLLDLLIGDETEFLVHLLRYFRLILTEWPPPLSKIDLTALMGCFIRLRLAIERLSVRGLFPYDVTPLIRRLLTLEERYERSELVMDISGLSILSEAYDGLSDDEVL